MNKHLEFSWSEVEEAISNTEKELIRIYMPFINIGDNPEPFQLIKDMRKQCVDFANS